jgi:tetratricopeptide (TPR) repeat protein
MRCLTLCAMTVLAFSTAGRADVEEFVVPVISGPQLVPKIDGTITAEEWKGAVRLRGLTNLETGRVSSRDAQVYFLADDEKLYVGVRAVFGEEGRPLSRTFERDDLEEAIGAYEEALELRPRHVQAWRVLGSLYAQTGQPQQAVEALEQALELSPNRNDAWDTHRMLAILHNQLGQQDTALSHAEQALQMAPENQQGKVEQLLAQLQGGE